MRSWGQRVLAGVHLLDDLLTPIAWIRAAGDHRLAHSSRAEGESCCSHADRGLRRQSGRDLREQRQTGPRLGIGRVILRLGRHGAGTGVRGGMFVTLRAQPLVEAWIAWSAHSSKGTAGAAEVPIPAS